MSTTVKKVLLFVGCLAVPLAGGFLSSFLSGDIRAIYDGMAKPPLAPPGWLFGVVWPVLYVLMGISIFLIFTSARPSAEKRPILWLFALQLILNFAWSIVFFRFGQLWPAVGIIGLMDILVFTCMVLSFRIRRVSGILLIPYLAWLLFATYLSIAFAFLN